MRLPVIALVGRPNVGKSTLFNRIARRRISIVEDTPGVTRDRLYAECRFDNTRFMLIDTGGFEPDPETQLSGEIRNQSQLAIEEADVIVMVVDARLGPTPPDIEVAEILRRSNRPVVIAGNKVDSPKQDALAHAFYELGIPELHAVSAEHGRGVGDVLEKALELLPAELREYGEKAQQEIDDSDGKNSRRIDNALDEAERLAFEEHGYDEDEEEENLSEDAQLNSNSPEVEITETLTEDELETKINVELDESKVTIEHLNADENTHDVSNEERADIRLDMPKVIRVCIIGKPNGGKSSLTNQFLGEERHLVSDIAGTTMDAVDSFVEYGGNNFRIIDTAGIRRKRSISSRMEKFAVVSALKGLDRADIALLVIDATLGVTEQDLKIAAFAHDKGRGLIIVVNKWDLRKEAELDAKEMRDHIRYRMPFVDYAPIRFVSAKTGRRVFDILDLIYDVATSYFSRVPTSDVNRVIRSAVLAHQPPVVSGRRVKLYFGAQVTVAPPTFVVACNHPDDVHFSYQRFIQNRFRDAFGFEGTPMRILLRQRGSQAGRQKNIEARARSKKLRGKTRGKGPKAERRQS